MSKYFSLKYTAITSQGRVRTNNEDNFFVNGIWKKQPEQSECQQEGECNSGYMIASVCDGMGGQELGEIASLLAVETWNEVYRWTVWRLQKNPFRTRLLECVNRANMRICEMMRKEQKQIGSTMTVLEFSQNKVISVNLGDSPSFRFRNGELLQMSEEHTLLQSMVRNGQMSKEEAKKNPLRHHLTQYLGIFPEEMELAPSVNDFGEIERNDIYLICSDGLTEMVTEEEIKSVLKQSIELKERAERLVKMALDAGGKDNITVVLIQVKDPISRGWNLSKS